MDVTETPITAKLSTNTLVYKLARIYFVIAVPLLLTLISVRLVMSPAFLSFEYNRPGFPEDRYGLTREERLEYAPYAVSYLLNSADISYLGDLTFPNGTPLYNDRELRHMVDVKNVTRSAFLLLTGGGILSIIFAILLIRSISLRPALFQGLRIGSLLTLTIISVIVIMAVIMWDIFFTTFHQLFFEDGTWRFYYSDTLIRLFPEQFWFDASLAIGILTTLGALLILLVTWLWDKHGYKMAHHRDWR